MDILKYTAIIFLSLGVLFILLFAVIGRKPIRILLINAILGIAFLIVINITKRFTGVAVPVNWYTVGSVSLYGIPALCLFLVFNAIA